MEVKSLGFNNCLVTDILQKKKEIHTSLKQAYRCLQHFKNFIQMLVLTSGFVLCNCPNPKLA